MWSSYVHPVVWDSSDFRFRNKMREDHCLVGCSAVWSGREAPLHTSSSALLEANVSMKCQCSSTRLHGVTYKNTVMLMTST